MATTLTDIGRGDKFGDIPFYYAFPIRFYFKSHYLIPDDVLTWCKENCEGYYKMVAYTHKDDLIRYCDKVYLQNEKDAMIIKLKFDVIHTTIKRERPERKKKI